MRRWTLRLLLVALCAAGAARAQDPVSFHLPHLQVLAEDAAVRVLKFTPRPGDRTPMHSHPKTVVYVQRGGRVKTTLPDGTVTITELKTGDVLLRDPVTHADEALDAVEIVIVELKR